MLLTQTQVLLYAESDVNRTKINKSGFIVPPSPGTFAITGPEPLAPADFTARHDDLFCQLNEVEYGFKPMKNTKKFLILLMATLSLSATAKAQLAPGELEENIRRALELNATASFSLARNWVEILQCFEAASREPISDSSAVAKACFINPWLKNRIAERPDAFTASNDRKIFFLKICTEIQACQEPDLMFGGERKLCGHTGNYIDYLTRVKGLADSTFRIEDAARLCGEALN